MARYRYYFRPRRYRRYLRRYLYRRSRKIANRISLNYYKAKIEIQLAVWHKNNGQGSVGTDWVIGNPSWTQDGAQWVLASGLRDDDEYKLYIPLYDEVQLTGVLIQSFPSAKNLSGGSINSHQLLSVHYKHDGLTSYGSCLYLNAANYCKKFWKIMDRKWTPVDQTVANITAGNCIPGLIQLTVPYEDAITQTNSPNWNLIVTCYVRFRKNKNNS